MLGEPYELLKAGDIDTWRYYERFEPRGCEQPKPVITREFRVLFRAGIVVRTEPPMSGSPAS